MASNSTNGVAVAERTVLDWLVQAGITETRALEHLENGWVRVDGELVTDPKHMAESASHVDFRIITRPDRQSQPA